MARTVKDARLESPTARASLKISGVPYWRALEPGLHIGYRKSRSGGRWVGRRYRGKGLYHSENLDGITDDRQEADGVGVLNFAQAQKRVRELLNATDKNAGPITVREACKRYVEYLKAEKKTGEDAEQRLALHVVGPADPDKLEQWKKKHPHIADIADRKVADLTMREIEAIKLAMVKRDPDDPDVERRSKDTANRTMTSLRAALSRAFADEDNHIPSNAAWQRVKSFKDVGRPREIFLDEAQRQRLVNATAGAFRNFVVAALLTGARPPHELAGARCRDFNPRLGTLAVDGKTGPRNIFLTEEAVEFFKGLSAGRAPDDLLLPKDDGTAWGEKHHVRPMREAVKRAKLPAKTTAYCLRHSYASDALLNGMNIQLLAENMGTSVLMIEKCYGKFSAASRRKMIEAGGLKLGLKPGNVTAMPARSANKEHHQGKRRRGKVNPGARML